MHHLCSQQSHLEPSRQTPLARSPAPLALRVHGNASTSSQHYPPGTGRLRGGGAPALKPNRPAAALIPEGGLTVATALCYVRTSLQVRALLTTSCTDGPLVLCLLSFRDVARHPVPNNVVDLYELMAGRDVRTTIMLRNIPNKVDQPLLKRTIDASSFGKYDFLYLRIDFANDCNVGCAFINFVKAEYIVDFVPTLGHIASGQAYKDVKAFINLHAGGMVFFGARHVETDGSHVYVCFEDLRDASLRTSLQGLCHDRMCLTVQAIMGLDPTTEAEVEAVPWNQVAEMMAKSQGAGTFKFSSVGFGPGRERALVRASLQSLQ
ncbi:meiosis protein mei2 [Fusarium sporotrichioides]|uniref:Meiosis protein mei2 n=1 Tax=Fusarium sporotrichioides TaxID=5514 RepID=A0A395RSK9_FUSSP|nr:meiosis protein mei2 [Fusarium sporotrichioides]